ncbi:helix-turn-helix transcriptional regulator [Roseinatronobacter bogoriensis]|uniref:YafY family transcriptional regulator n=1 Tax=Roseinatronobacter bogoriensis subsp. barguzinensis TaxID=441209 RepID=A0A2K8K6H0_9RHOB|nr:MULTISPECIES: YafY family protein [Rhodobaca]ATX65041.1 YafY family transcriptional regulator [Rhodobaca barguzinensis]MBB4208877.1 putative DNA-binding transcriptional regulator YafY [Rhodobaca bogoriensis DSM 18756]TDW37856.1 WYL domain-containing protein [Rhodobaca barguzinensis]TDY69975.1 WYL domain-containing protein [Rhodobaca bogoriensis DSM 18756]
MKSLRLFSLLDHLRAARRPVSASTLAQRLGVSTRTIYRDIASLQGIGAPIRGESGLGYQLEKGYFLPPLQFDVDEMEAIMLGLRLLTARRGGGFHDAVERVTGKVAAALGAEGGERFQGLTLLAVSRQREADHLAEPWGGIVRVAIRERTIMKLTYRSLDGRESQRHVHPLGLTLFDDVWLLTAWCESVNDFRNFRLDRITSIENTGKKFHPRQGQLFKDYLATL